MATEATSVDVAIVGGGLAGASLALALRALHWRVALVEAFAPDSAAQPSFDERTTALGNASRRVFEALGVWPRLAAEAGVITDIHVSDAGRFGFARVGAREQGLEALGYVVPNRVLGRELWEALRDARGLTALMPARVTAVTPGADSVRIEVAQGDAVRRLDASLVVAADGTQSLVRAAAGLGASVDDYDQVALVATVVTDRANDGVAFERFTDAGPMALLPLAATAGAGARTLVWAARPAEAARLAALPDAQFLAEWQAAFGWRAGRATALGRRVQYPLALTRSDGAVAPRIALLGNAAQSLHPVAGQGFNLALRDVAVLAELLADPSLGADAGAAQRLARFAAERQSDRDGVVRFTDTLVRGFSGGGAARAAARNAGLLLFDLLPPAKRALARVSLGFGARAPRLTRGLPLARGT